MDLDAGSKEVFTLVSKACHLTEIELESFIQICVSLGMGPMETFSLLSELAKDHGNELRLEAGLFDRTGKAVIETKKASKEAL